MNLKKCNSRINNQQTQTLKKHQLNSRERNIVFMQVHQKDKIPMLRDNVV